MGSLLTLSSPLAFPHPLMEEVYLGVTTCEVFLCSGVIVYLLYIISRFIVVLVVLCFTSLVSFTGFYTEDEPMEAQKYYSLLKTHLKKLTYFALRSLTLVLPYVLQQELNNVDHVSLMLRKCDHPYQRRVNVQTSWHTTLSLFISICQRVDTVLLFRLTR